MSVEKVSHWSVVLTRTYSRGRRVWWCVWQDIDSAFRDVERCFKDVEGVPRSRPLRFGSVQFDPEFLRTAQPLPRHAHPAESTDHVRARITRKRTTHVQNSTQHHRCIFDNDFAQKTLN